MAVRNGRTAATVCSQSGISARGATQPEANEPRPHQSIHALVVWVLQNPTRAKVDAMSRLTAYARMSAGATAASRTGSAG